MYESFECNYGTNLAQQMKELTHQAIENKKASGRAAANEKFIKVIETIRAVATNGHNSYNIGLSNIIDEQEIEFRAVLKSKLIQQGFLVQENYPHSFTISW